MSVVKIPFNQQINKRTRESNNWQSINWMCATTWLQINEWTCLTASFSSDCMKSTYNLLLCNNFNALDRSVAFNPWHSNYCISIMNWYALTSCPMTKQSNEKETVRDMVCHKIDWNSYTRRVNNKFVVTYQTLVLQFTDFENCKIHACNCPALVLLFVLPTEMKWICFCPVRDRGIIHSNIIIKMLRSVYPKCGSTHSKNKTQTDSCK